MLGQKIVELADKIKQNCKNERAQYEVTFLLWNSKLDEHVSITLELFVDNQVSFLKELQAG